MTADMMEVMQAIAAYGLHSDAGRWPALVDLFAPEVRVDYTALQGGEPATVAAIDLVRSWEGFLPGFSGTSHLIGLPLIEIADDSARAEAPFTASHHIDDPALGGADRWAVGGSYGFELVRLDSRWRISAVQIRPAWQSGNRDLPSLAAARASPRT